MSELDEQIALARRHVQDGRRIVERQQEHILRGEGDVAEAKRLLLVLEQT
jgi:hypothetical protein